jgi:hypothetical protein
MELDAAIAAFDANPANNGGKVEGTIVYTGPGSLDPRARLKIVGARLQSNIANIGYKSRAVYFDPRFDGGQFAPPFFPGVETREKPKELRIGFAGEQAIVVFADSWQRDTRRHKS